MPRAMYYEYWQTRRRAQWRAQLDGAGKRSGAKDNARLRFGRGAAGAGVFQLPNFAFRPARWLRFGGSRPTVWAAQYLR